MATIEPESNTVNVSTHPALNEQQQSEPQPQPNTILLINGPNLNLLGHREPSIYGSTTLTQIETHLHQLASSRGIRVLTFQSNHEGAIVDRIHDAFWANLKAKQQAQQTGQAEGAAAEQNLDTVDGIIVNPGAYTHTSVAIRDALAGASIPFVECHISNVHAREAFRHKSFLSDKAEAVIAGLGVFGYVAALEWWCWKWKGGKLEDAGS